MTAKIILATGQDSQWFNKNKSKDGPYYEGLLDQPNARHEYELIGFFAVGLTTQSLPGQPPKDSKFYADYFVPNDQSGGTKPHPVLIQARQIASRTNYLMQSEPKEVTARPNSWNQFPWKTERVMGYKINPNNLGVVARFGDIPDEGDLVPVIFYLDPPNDQEIHNYELLLKVQRYSLSSLQYKIEAPANMTRPTICYYDFAKPCASSPPRPPATIEVGTVLTIKFSVSSRSGPCNIDINGQYKNSSEKLVVSYKFYHEAYYRRPR